MEHLQNFIGDCDRKTEMAKRRLKETQEELSEEANAKVNAVKLFQFETKRSELSQSETKRSNLKELMPRCYGKLFFFFYWSSS